MKPETSLCSASALRIDRNHKTILNHLDFELTAGTPFAIIGESGSGKTTLLLALVGLLPATEGMIQFGTRKLSDLSLDERASTYGLVFQDYQLFSHLTVLENLLLAPQLRKLDISNNAAQALLENLGIGHLGQNLPTSLSGGQKQRVAIARSLILKPRILFLDEPSAALDEKTTVQLADLLIELNQKTQIVAVSHDRFFLSRFAKRGIKMHQGQLIAAGDLGTIFPETERHS
jgi:ABC-type lipoprotein export system ATPase subunit